MNKSNEFARVIARLINEQLPKFTSIERTVKDRKGKMYIDFLQNRPQATVSAPAPKARSNRVPAVTLGRSKKGLQMKHFYHFHYH